MKSLSIGVTLFLTVTTLALAQVPQGFTYQSIVRDASGNPISNAASLPVRFKIFRGVDSIYVETHTASTNEFGLLTLTVGQGVATLGSFPVINWSTGTFSLKVEINFGTGFENMGTNQLFTLPFAMISGKTFGGVSPFTIDAVAGQPNPKPMILLRDSAGNNLMRIHADVSANTFVGLDAGKSNQYTNDTTGNANTFIGSLAGYSHTQGYFNTALGREALYTTTSGEENTAVGGRALFSNTVGDANTATGRSALYNNTIGNSNTAFGVRALYSNVDGDANTAVGRSALTSNTTGSNNTSFGRSALLSNTSGSNNIGFGVRALYSNLIGNKNIGIGDSALFTNGVGATLVTQGAFNTAIGSKALYSNALGASNTAIGRNALLLTVSSGNTAIGNQAGDGFQNGNNNTFIGNGSDATLTNLTNSTAIGNGATFSASNTMVFGNSAVTGWGFGTVPDTFAIKIGTGITNGNNARLTRRGIWTAGNYNYLTAQTHYASYTSHAFNSVSPNLAVLDNAIANEYCYFINGAGTLSAAAPVHLPDGATVSEYRVWLYDNDAVNATQASLYAVTSGTATKTTVATVQTTAAGASASVQNLSSAAAHVIDNATNGYYIQWSGVGANSNIRLYGIRITYTVTKPD